MTQGSDQVPFAGDRDRLRAILGAQLVEQRGHVELHRAFGDPQLVRDLLVRLPLGHQADHFAFALRQALSRSEDVRRHARVEVRIPVGNHFDRALDLFDRRALQQISFRARAHRAFDIFLRVVRGEHQNRSPQPLDRIEPAHPRQLEIEKDDVGVHTIDRFFGRRHTSRDLEFTLERSNQSLTDDGLIVDDRDARHTFTTIFVPLPRPDVMRSDLPAMRARSRMPSMPCRSAGMRRTSNPTPSSSTASVACFALQASDTRTLLALACWRTLVSACSAMRYNSASTGSARAQLPRGSKVTRIPDSDVNSRTSAASACASGLPANAPARRLVTDRRASSRFSRAIASAFWSRSRTRAGSRPTLSIAVSICSAIAVSPCASVSWISRARRVRSSPLARTALSSASRARSIATPTCNPIVPNSRSSSRVSRRIAG